METKPNPLISKKRSNPYYTYVEPLIIDPVVRGYFTLIASLLLVAFFIAFALSPTISTILTLVKKIDEEKALVRELNDKINSLVIAQENYSQAESYLPLLAIAIPSRPTPETTIDGLIRAASESAVAITSFQIGNVSLDPKNQLEKPAIPSPINLPTTTFSVGVKGAEASINQFFHRATNLPRVLSLTLISVTKENRETEFIGDVAGVAYFFDEKSPEASSAGLLP